MLARADVLLHADMAVWNLLSSLGGPEVPLVVGREDRASATSTVELGASRSVSSKSVSIAETSMMHLRFSWWLWSVGVEAGLQQPKRTHVHMYCAV